MNALIGFRLTPEQMRKLVEWMDSHGLVDDLAEERYLDPAVFAGALGVPGRPVGFCFLHPAGIFDRASGWLAHHVKRRAEMVRRIRSNA